MGVQEIKMDKMRALEITNDRIECLNNFIGEPVKAIVVDDGSTDNTKNILKNYLKYGNMKIIFNEHGGEIKMERQLTIFDIAINEQIKKSGITEELTELASQYLIDSHYKKITFGRTLTLNEIEKSLMKFKRFPEYINKVYEILSRHYDIIKEFEDVTDFQVIGIAKRDNSIRIYQPRHQYSIWCISMIDNEFYKYAK